MRVLFSGTLTSRDCKRHLPHAFSVPPGATDLTIDFAFSPHRAQGMLNLLTLTLFDPQGFRGAGHRHGSRHVVRLSSADATPGHEPGPLPPGEWVAQIDTHMVMPGEPVSYTLTVEVSFDAPEARASREPAVATDPLVPNRGPDWYRGDLHCHTVHSDGRRTVAELADGARALGLDFVFLTDHNTTAGLREMRRLSGADLLLTGGMELTTFHGHALVLGARSWVDWRIQPGAGDMARIASAAYARGEVFVIAHPLAVGDPSCTGCRWRYGDVMPGPAEVVEVWNGPWESDGRNAEALSLFYDWLNQGWRMVATAGTDSHHNDDYERGPAFTLIRANALSEPALLAGLRAGRAYVSAGPRLTFEAEDDAGIIRTMGDAVTRPARFSSRWSGASEDAELRIIADGKLLLRRSAGKRGEHSWRMSPADARWVLVELRDGQGRMLALANPIYLSTEPDRD